MSPDEAYAAGYAQAIDDAAKKCEREMGDCYEMAARGRGIRALKPTAQAVKVAESAATQPTPEGIDGETANLREAIESGDPHRLLVAVGHELRCVANYHGKGFGTDTRSVRKGFLLHLAACIGAADTLLYAPQAQARTPSAAGAASAPEGTSAHRACPFCGDRREPEIQREVTVPGGAEGDVNNGPIYTAECQRCGAAGPVCSAPAEAMHEWDHGYTPQADAKAIPSSASPPPPPEGATMGDDTSAIPTAISRRDRRIADLTARAEAAERNLASVSDAFKHERESRAAAEAQAGRYRDALVSLSKLPEGPRAGCVSQYEVRVICQSALSPAQGGSSGEADHA